MSTDPQVATEEHKLSTQLVRREVDDATWNTLKNSIFPGASNASILMAVDYCLARKLDVLKKPCHIVPMEVKTGKKDQNGWDLTEWRDIIMPGIYELRTTAMRTGQYAGCSDVEFGETVEFMGVKAPMSARMVVYRFAKNGQKIEFPATVYFEEACAMKGKGDKRAVNAMWTKRPRGQMDKCAEAAALRKAFPEELGGIQSADEMAGQVIGDVADPVVAQQTPATRTEQAKANLQRSLTDQKGTGGLDLPLNKGTDAEVVMNSSFEGSPGDGMPKASSTRQKGTGGLDLPLNKGTDAEVIARELAGQKQLDAARREENKQREPEKKKDPPFKYGIAEALAHLRSKTTSAELKNAYREVEDDFEFSGRELPIDVEAIYRDLREALMEREAIQAENKHE